MDILPRNLMAGQLDQVDLLRAMYPERDELSIEDHSLTILTRLRQWCEGSDSAKPAMVPAALSLNLTLSISAEEGTARSISMHIEAPLTQPSAIPEAPPLKVRVLQPDWLTKAELALLIDGIPVEDVLSAIEHVREAASAYLATQHESQMTRNNQSAKPTVRVWFYFPSISTREKRDDLVTHAPSYGLTGFLLAGKPGILCLEGDAQDIDDYMKFIKTESWGDIPSQHKKVSERHRETEDVNRCFKGMQEITDQLEKRGERSNRSDMKALESWLAERELGNALQRVLM